MRRVPWIAYLTTTANKRTCEQAHKAAHMCHGAVSPKDGTCVYLIMPTSNTACFQVFLDVLARRFARQDILLVLDGAPNHRCGDLAVPNNIMLLYLPPYSPELNPKENLWDEIREKIFKNYALKSMDAVRAKLKQAILYIERNPSLSAPSAPSPISSTHSDVELVLAPKKCSIRRPSGIKKLPPET
jgi:hypothetical protein